MLLCPYRDSRRVRSSPSLYDGWRTLVLEVIVDRPGESGELADLVFQIVFEFASLLIIH